MNKVVFGGHIPKPDDPVKARHNFAGWQLGDTPFDFDNPVTDHQFADNSHLSFKAIWKPHTYVGTFDAPNFCEQTVLHYGGLVTYPTEPTLPGHNFVGWKLNDELIDSSFVIDDDFAQERDLVDGSEICFTAYFEPFTFTFSFDLDGGTQPQSTPAPVPVKKSRVSKSITNDQWAKLLTEASMKVTCEESRRKVRDEIVAQAIESGAPFRMATKAAKMTSLGELHIDDLQQEVLIVLINMVDEELTNPGSWTKKGKWGVCWWNKFRGRINSHAEKEYASGMTSTSVPIRRQITANRLWNEYQSLGLAHLHSDFFSWANAKLGEAESRIRISEAEAARAIAGLSYHLATPFDELEPVASSSYSPEISESFDTSALLEACIVKGGTIATVAKAWLENGPKSLPEVAAICKIPLPKIQSWVSKIATIGVQIGLGDEL
jgi:hypothetical protein